MKMWNIGNTSGALVNITATATSQRQVPMLNSAEPNPTIICRTAVIGPNLSPNRPASVELAIHQKCAPA